MSQTGVFLGHDQNGHLRNASSGAVRPKSPWARRAISGSISEKVCFIEVKRYINEWPLCGDLLCWEVQSGNIDFAMRFHCFPTHFLVWELSGISFRPDSRSHTAAAAATISGSMQRCSIRMYVQILMFYWGKTNIGANVSCWISSLITKHSHRIAFRVVNPSFFGRWVWVVNFKTNYFQSPRGPTCNLNFWAGTASHKKHAFLL